MSYWYNLDKVQNHYVVRKNPDTEDFILFDSTHMKSEPNKSKLCMVIGNQSVVVWVDGWEYLERGMIKFLGDGNVLFLVGVIETWDGHWPTFTIKPVCFNVCKLYINKKELEEKKQ